MDSPVESRTRLVLSCVGKELLSFVNPPAVSEDIRVSKSHKTVAGEVGGGPGRGGAGSREIGVFFHRVCPVFLDHVRKRSARDRVNERGRVYPVRPRL